MNIDLISVGMTYPCLIGAMVRLNEAGYAYESISGVSSGAFIASMIGTGYKVNGELTGASKKAMPSKIKNSVNFSNFLMIMKGYLNSGKSMHSVFEELVMKSLGESRIPLQIRVFCESDGLIRSFSSKNDPEVSVSKLVQASFSLPIIFAPVKIKGKLYSDAIAQGMNFDNDQDDELIIKVSSSGIKRRNMRDVKVVEQLQGVYAACSKQGIPETKNTILINTDFSPLAFNISNKDVDSMINSGYEATSKWLAQ